MWPYICMIPIFCSRPTPAMFCDETMYIYYNSTALEPHYCWMWHHAMSTSRPKDHHAMSTSTGHHAMSTSRPKEYTVVTLLSCHPNGDTQLLKLGIVSFTHTKQRGVFSPQMKITFLFEYPVYAINRTMFFTYEWFWFQIQESHEKTRLWRLTDKELVTVICIHSAKYCAVAKLCRVNKKTKNLQRFAQVKNKQPQRIKHAV